MLTASSYGYSKLVGENTTGAIDKHKTIGYEIKMEGYILEFSILVIQRLTDFDKEKCCVCPESGEWAREAG